MEATVSVRRRQQRDAIMKATARLAGEVGWQQVTMRRLAAALGVQAASIYEYFPGKEGILAGLVADGSGRLLSRILAPGNEPDLKTLAKRVWAFAWEEPQVYQAMNGLAGVPYGWDWRQPQAKALFAVARSAIEREVGETAGLDLDAATDICWALIHGTIALAMAGRLAGSRTRASRLVELAIETLLSGWRSSVTSGARNLSRRHVPRHPINRAGRT